MKTAQLVELPANDASRVYEALGYVEAYDAMLNDDYAFLAYKETDNGTGEWRVRIKARQLTGAVFEPAMMKSKAREMGAQGKAFFTWGACMDPSPTDARSVQFRVYQQGGKASEIEIFVQCRKFDGTPDEAKSCRFPWPG